MTQNLRHSNRKAWIVCCIASLFFFYEIMQLTIFNSISDDLMRTFDLSNIQLGRLSASYFYVCSIFLLPAGLLYDRYSTKLLLILSTFLCLVGVFLLARTNHIEIATLGRVLTGVGNAFSFLGCMRLASRWFAKQKLGLAMGVTVTIAMLGGVVSQVPFTWLVQTQGWRVAMQFNGLLGITILLLLIIFVKDAPISLNHNLNSIPEHQSLSFIKQLKLAASKYQNWLCGLYTCFLNLPIMLLGALWGNLFLVQGHGCSETMAAKITSFIFIGMIIGAPLLGGLSDKLNNRRFIMISAALLITCIMLIIIFTPVSFPLLIILFLLLGILGGAQILTYPIVTHNNPLYLESTCMGLIGVILNIGGALSQIIFAYLLNYHWISVTQNGVPLHTLQQYQFALVMMPLAFLVSVGLAMVIKDSYATTSE